jgi:hypothetical protein
MKLFKFGLRIWITLTSVSSFLAGWVLLAHSPKPAQPKSAPPVVVTPLPTLAPLNLSDSSTGSNFQNMPLIIQQPSVFAPAPVFRTGGS